MARQLPGELLRNGPVGLAGFGGDFPRGDCRCLFDCTLSAGASIIWPRAWDEGYVR
jgi:hypothetical protein